MASITSTASQRHVSHRAAESRVDPRLTAIIVEQVATYNRTLAYGMSAVVVFCIGFYAATMV